MRTRVRCLSAFRVRALFLFCARSFVDDDDTFLLLHAISPHISYAPMVPRLLIALLVVVVVPAFAFVPLPAAQKHDVSSPVVCHAASSSRRTFFGAATALVAGGAALLNPSSANAVGPVKIDLNNPVYTAVPCPKSKPMPGQMAMKGMKGMCVTVDVDLAEAAPKDLEKVGVYGFVTDAETGESVLANNPDLSTDAGQFTLIELITPKDKKIQFEFVAAVDPAKDLSQYENGIGPLSFQSLRVVSFPGGQQYGAISPCEMNEFSSECEEWEEENGPYVKGDYMMRSNPRTKGR